MSNSALPVQQRYCHQCAGYDSSKGSNGSTGACRFKPYDYCWDVAALQSANDGDLACDRFKEVELPF